MGTLDPNDPRLQAPRPSKRTRWVRALRSGLLWCIAGLVLGFLYIAEYAHDGESLFVRSRMGLGMGGLCGFLGFVLRLVLPTEKEREEDQGGGV